LVVTGVNGGHAIDLRRFAADGMVLLGKLRGIEDGTAAFAADVEARLVEADESARELVHRVDEHIRRSGVAALAAQRAAEAEPRAPAPVPSAVRLDLGAAGIATVICCTGYGFDFGRVRLPVFDARGRPVQRRGVTACRGDYFVGRHWMPTFKSGTLVRRRPGCRVSCRAHDG
jgi:putative flavoprotein involved in K+ transport